MSHIVAIDGPAGAGKSTVARRVAVSLGFAFVDTGAIYRTVALAALKEHIELHDGAALAAMTTRLKMHFETKQDGNLVFLEGEDVTANIRSREVSTAASEVSSIRRLERIYSIRSACLRLKVLALFSKAVTLVRSYFRMLRLKYSWMQVSMSGRHAVLLSFEGRARASISRNS